MAANDEFPRKWTFSTIANGTAASLTVPPATNISHVLDAIDAIALNSNTGWAEFTVALTSSDGIFTTQPIGHVAIAPTSGGQSSAGDLELAAGPGASLTVAYTAGQTGVNQYLRIQGHDI